MSLNVLSSVMSFADLSLTKDSSPSDLIGSLTPSSEGLSLHPGDDQDAVPQDVVPQDVLAFADLLHQQSVISAPTLPPVVLDVENSPQPAPEIVPPISADVEPVTCTHETGECKVASTNNSDTLEEHLIGATERQHPIEGALSQESVGSTEATVQQSHPRPQKPPSEQPDHSHQLSPTSETVPATFASVASQHNASASSHDTTSKLNDTQPPDPALIPSLLSPEGAPAHALHAMPVSDGDVVSVPTGIGRVDSPKATDSSQYERMASLLSEKTLVPVSPSSSPTESPVGPPSTHFANQAASSLSTTIDDAASDDLIDVHSQERLPRESVFSQPTDAQSETRLRTTTLKNRRPDVVLPKSTMTGVRRSVSGHQSLSEDTFETAPTEQASIVPAMMAHSAEFAGSRPVELASLPLVGDAAPVDIASRIVRLIVSNMTRAESNEIVSIDAELQPPELGRLRIRLTKTENGLTAIVAAENEDVHQIIVSHASLIEQSVRAELALDESLQFQVSGQTTGADPSASGNAGHRRKTHPHHRHPPDQLEETERRQRSIRADIDVLA